MRRPEDAGRLVCSVDKKTVGGIFSPKWHPLAKAQRKLSFQCLSALDRRGRAWTGKFPRSLASASGACLEEAAWCGSLWNLSSPLCLQPSLPRPMGHRFGSSPRGGLSFSNGYPPLCSLDAELPSTAFCVGVMWHFHSNFTGEEIEAQVVCPSSHPTPSLLTPGPGPRRAQVAGLGARELPSGGGGGPLGREGAFSSSVMALS